MLELLPQSTDTCLGFKVSGKLSAEDYAVFLPKLDETIAAAGKINLLLVMDHFEGYADIDVAKTDFEFGKHQYHQVEKAAFVGDKKWQKWMVKAIDPFTRRTDERFYEIDRLEEAWQWIKETD